jgi:multiple sugar transport system substrate-binding protein
LIEANNYDLSDFDAATVKFLEVKEEGQLGIPFAIYPSFTFVNKDLFDEAGLPYPPQEYGAPYVDENGDEHDWDMDTLRDLAMKLTVDANGNDATSADFDADNIVQFGYLNQFTDMRGALTTFGAGNFVSEDNTTAEVPDSWRDGAQWIYDAMWKDHFWPTDAYVQSDVLATPNPFASGHLAMATVHMWYAAAWALGDIDFVWDTAVQPAYKGVTTAKMHADTFGILKASKHPQEAFEVLTYMSSAEHATDLLTIYGGMPARLSLQGDYFENYSATVFPGQDINWQVVADSAAYADHPNHEAYLPSYQESTAKYGEYWTKWQQEPDLDLNAEFDQLILDLQAIYDAANK